MDANTKKELEDIIRELNTITKELDSIAYGIANEFKGVGSSRCAQYVKILSDKYKIVKNEIVSIK